MRNKLQEYQLKQSGRSISAHTVAVTVVVVVVVVVAAAAASSNLSDIRHIRSRRFSQSLRASLRAAKISALTVVLLLSA